MKNKFIIDNNMLKIIAVITMTIDHISYKIIYGLYMVGKPSVFINGVNVLSEPSNLTMKLLDLYELGRFIGRLSFPIFAYLMVEGFVYTKSRKLYLKRLIFIALISEIPFDLFTFDRAIDWEGQNVIWLFVISFITLEFLDYLRRLKFSKVELIIKQLMIVILSTIIAYFFNIGYSIGGIFLITTLYLFKENLVLCVLGVISSIFLITLTFGWTQLFSLIAFIIIYFSNGKKSNINKYFFYIYYPSHLLILWLVSNVF